MASLSSLRRIPLIEVIRVLFALAILAIGTPANVCAEETEPAQLVNADRSASKDPFRNLFVTDGDSTFAIKSTSFERLTVDPSQTQKPPEPTHTGFTALLFETASDFNAYPRRRSTWVILGIGGAAAALVHPIDDEVNEKLVGSDAVGKFFAPGKYIGAVYTQAGVAVGLYVIGRYVLPHTDDAPRTNRVSHIGFDMLRAIIVSQALTQGIKYAVQRDRPTGDCCAFPSGHASATFATASVIERHFGYRGSWPMFLIASYVATSRLHDNRHFLSDVVFGAAVGVSTGWTVVGRHGRSKFSLTPVPVRGGVVVAVTRKPPTSETRSGL